MKKNRKQRMNWQKAVIVTVGLILIISAGSFIASNWINKMEDFKSVSDF